MACNKPLTGYQPVGGGKLVFTRSRAHAGYTEIQVPCGQCAGCRLEHSRQWAMRCVHEASLHDENCFITLTYDDAHLPHNGSLQKSDLQRFWKRLRKERSEYFRYYACGEYGETTQRAHYHACVFGLNFSDRTPLRRIGEHTLYHSISLERIWGNGHVSIGELTFESAAYCARYVMKKQTGLAIKKGGGYATVDGETGEIIRLQQPYANMSLKPAIGKAWFNEYHTDIYNNDKDYIVQRGQKLKPTRYYDKLYDGINPDHLKRLKQLREENSEKLTDKELHAREEITRARIIQRKQV